MRAAEEGTCRCKLFRDSNTSQDAAHFPKSLCPLQACDLFVAPELYIVVQSNHILGEPLVLSRRVSTIACSLQRLSTCRTSAKDEVAITVAAFGRFKTAQTIHRVSDFTAMALPPLDLSRGIYCPILRGRSYHVSMDRILQMNLLVLLSLVEQ